MAYKIGIAGEPNSGKSYSRRTIQDGENVIIVAPSLKAAHLITSDGKPVKPFDIHTNQYKNIEEAMAGLKVSSRRAVLANWNAKLTSGKFKKENLDGNMIKIDSVEDIPVYAEFVSKHLPWIHTLILPDFTHFISNEISDSTFINRKNGGDAYQRFWELAAKALRNFITGIDQYRHDLLVVTEYHAKPNDQGIMDIFVPAGNMLTEKFLPTSYYDVLVFTDIKINNVGEDDEHSEYRFVTKPTSRYKYARAMNLYESTYVDNDLQELCNRVRKYLGIELPAGTVKTA